MLELGIIQQANPGSFHFLPLGIKSLNKLKNIVNDEMCRVGGQKVMFPSLINSKLWKNSGMKYKFNPVFWSNFVHIFFFSGRLKNAGSELFQLKDRHNHDYVLSPVGK